MSWTLQATFATLLAKDGTIAEHLVRAACDSMPAVRQAAYDSITAWAEQDLGYA